MKQPPESRPIVAVPTARGPIPSRRHGGRPLDGMRNLISDTLNEMGYTPDPVLVDTLIERDVVDFRMAAYTSHVMNDLVEHYGEVVLCGGLEEAVILEEVGPELREADVLRWRALKGKQFEERIQHLITEPIEALGVKVVSLQELERGETLSADLEAVKRKLSVKFGEFGFYLPDVDTVVYDPKNSKVIAVILSEVTAIGQIAKACYWKSKLLENEGTAHIKVYFVTLDRGECLTSVFLAGKERAIAENDLDGTYVLTAANLEENDKVKSFVHFVPDFRQLIEGANSPNAEERQSCFFSTKTRQ